MDGSGIRGEEAAELWEQAGQREGEKRDKFRRDREGKRGRGRERRGGRIVGGPNVVVTGDVALPDDISPGNYLSVQRDSARRPPVLMPTDNVPILSRASVPRLEELSNRQLECTAPTVHS